MRAKERLPLFDSERDEGVFIDNSIIVASLVTSERGMKRRRTGRKNTYGEEEGRKERR